MCELRGLIRFGQIFNSEVRATDVNLDSAFSADVLSFISQLAQREPSGESPDDFILESWYPYPSAIAGGPTSFMGLALNSIALFDALFVAHGRDTRPPPASPLPPAPPQPNVLPSGNYLVANQTIYYSNGLGQVCYFGTWPSYLRAGGSATLTGVTALTSLPSQVQNNGMCKEQ